MQEMENTKKGYKMLFSLQDTIVTIMNSEQLWMLAPVCRILGPSAVR